MPAFSDLKQDQLLREVDADIAILVAWVEDTYTPSLNMHKLSVMVGELLQDVITHEEKKGVSEKTTSSKKKFIDILQLVDEISKVANQNNTFQLITRKVILDLSKANKRISELEAELKAIQEAWNEPE